MPKKMQKYNFFLISCILGFFNPDRIQMIVATIIITIMIKNIDKKRFSKVPNMGMYLVITAGIPRCPARKSMYSVELDCKSSLAMYPVQREQPP